MAVHEFLTHYTVHEARENELGYDSGTIDAGPFQSEASATRRARTFAKQDSRAYVVVKREPRLVAGVASDVDETLVCRVEPKPRNS